MEAIIHGGNLPAAEKQFGIKRKDWLDLSTGINPDSWSIPDIPVEVWNQLPEESDGLIEAARKYYMCDSLLPVPGTQFAIQSLPKLFPKGTTVAIPEVGYQEHYAAWQREGHHLFLYADNELDEIEKKIKYGNLDVVLVINPNNPSCKFISKEKLISWLMLLKQKNGQLIIDEAFMDCTPELSMVEALNSNHLIILKSLGKFFGLAGLRLGFVLAKKSICFQLKQQLGLWGVNHPARWIGTNVLIDSDWQEKTRVHLKTESQRLNEYIKTNLCPDSTNTKSTNLFVTCSTDKTTAYVIYENLARQGVLVRHINTENEGLIRFGLLKNQQEWEKFDFAIQMIKGLNENQVYHSKIKRL